MDGQIESNSLFRDAPIDTLPGDDVRFGMRAGDSWISFNGSLDEVRIYGCALTQEEIADLTTVTK